jgi:hypothetical protein
MKQTVNTGGNPTPGAAEGPISPILESGASFARRASTELAKVASEVASSLTNLSHHDNAIISPSHDESKPAPGMPEHYFPKNNVRTCPSERVIWGRTGIFRDGVGKGESKEDWGCLDSRKRRRNKTEGKNKRKRCQQSRLLSICWSIMTEQKEITDGKKMREAETVRKSISLPFFPGHFFPIFQFKTKRHRPPILLSIQSLSNFFFRFPFLLLFNDFF